MSTAREDLVEHLRTQLPAEIKVFDAIETISNLKRAGVLVTRSAVTPNPENMVDQRDDELTVWLVSPFLDIVKAEADLDQNLDLVLAAIEAHDYLHWTDGTRDVFADAWHAFRVTVPHRTLTNEDEE